VPSATYPEFAELLAQTVLLRVAVAAVAPGGWPAGAGHASLSALRERSGVQMEWIDESSDLAVTEGAISVGLVRSRSDKTSLYLVARVGTDRWVELRLRNDGTILDEKTSKRLTME
jgi:hypothetical protein